MPHPNPRLHQRRTLLAGAASSAVLALATGLAPPARAQAWPARPVRIVVAYPPGGTTDIYARLLAVHLQEQLGQTVIVDNRAGAAGVIGLDHVAKASPDGYTLALGLGAMAIMPSLRATLPFDPVRDFAAISLVLTTQNVLIVPAASPLKSVAELLAQARAQPGQLNYASSGAGATPHLGMELLKSMARVDIRHIPYKGDSPAMTDLLGGQVQMYASTIGGLLPYIRSGKVRALAVTGRRRSAALPEVPTMEEAGLPGYEIVSWYGLVAPAGTPAEVVARLHAAVAKGVATADFRDKVLASGSEPASSTPEQFQALIGSDVVRFRQIARSAGVVPE